MTLNVTESGLLQRTNYNSIRSFLRQHNPMIVAGTGPLIYIDLGKDEPGMTLQRRYREGREIRLE